ncbi:MAG TPA: hypothetical protein VIK59_09015 [Verrucomicrobiae bacterium]
MRIYQVALKKSYHLKILMPLHVCAVDFKKEWRMFSLFYVPNFEAPNSICLFFHYPAACLLAVCELCFGAIRPTGVGRGAVS